MWNYLLRGDQSWDEESKTYTKNKSENRENKTKHMKSSSFATYQKTEAEEPMSSDFHHFEEPSDPPYSSAYSREKQVKGRTVRNIDRMGIDIHPGYHIESLKKIIENDMECPKDPGELPLNPYTSSVGQVNPGYPRILESIDYVEIFGADCVYEVMGCDELRIMLFLDAYEKTPLQFWDKGDRARKKPGHTISKRLMYAGVSPSQDECKRMAEDGRISFIPMYRFSINSSAEPNDKGLISIVKNIAAPFVFSGAKVYIPAMVEATVAEESPVRVWREYSPTKETVALHATDERCPEGALAAPSVEKVAGTEIADQFEWYAQNEAIREYHDAMSYVNSLSQSSAEDLLRQCAMLREKAPNKKADVNLIHTITKFKNEMAQRDFNERIERDWSGARSY
jgi:hypothetical protein